MSSKATRLCFLLAFILALAKVGFGQIIVSSMVGQVTDTTGAAIPAAPIVITNEDTRISVHASTDAAGTYSVPNLYAGVYEIQVNKEGFEAVLITGIRVLAAQTVRQDVVLKVGAVSQSVTVKAETPLIHTDSINIAGEITNLQLSELPFQTECLDIVLTMVPGGQAANRTNPETGGANYWGGTNYAVDGAASNDSQNGRGNAAYGIVGAALVSYPPLTSLQEVTVESNNEAQYRMEATVSMVTKQGSNKFHGSAYEYNQNTIMTANTFALNAAREAEPAYNRNQFGGNLGGPLWRNKAFFFFNFSGFRQRQSSIVQLEFPSAAMRQGDLSALCTGGFTAGTCTAGTQLYNPTTGAPFANNQIPTTMFTSQSNTLISYLPTLTTNSTSLPSTAPNYVTAVPIPNDFDAYDARLDYQLTAKDNLSAFVTHIVGDPWGASEGTPPNWGNGEHFGFQNISYQLVETHIFSPTTTNDVHVNWHYEPLQRSGQDANFDPRTLFPQITPSVQRGLPTINWTGYSGISDYGIQGWMQQPGMEFIDNFTHVHGRHTLKAGVDLNGTADFRPSRGVALPTFGFTGVWTGNKGNPGQPHSAGNGFADFLLGDAASSSTSTNGADTKLYDKDWELYFQDTWQATGRLTVYYGVRYMDQLPYTVRNNARSHYDFASNKIALPENSATPSLPAVGADPGLYNAFLSYFTTTQALGLPTNYITNHKNEWGPRVGFAYRPFANGKTVVRAGYGMFYALDADATGIIFDAENIPFNAAGANSPPSETFNTALPGSPSSQFLPDITFANPFPSTVGGGEVVPAHPTLSVVDRNFKLPILQAWNLTVEHQIGKSDMVRASYLGNQTTHLKWYSYDQNRPIVQNVSLSQQNQRPIQPWAAIGIDTNGGKGDEDELQLEYIRHLARGLSAQAEYAWTRALSDATAASTPQVRAYPRLDYDENSIIYRHCLVFNYIYELPFGRGKQFMTNAHGVVDDFLGGWQVSGITTYHTGFPFTVNFQVPSSYVGWWGGRADKVSNVDRYAKQGGHNITNGVGWFNPAAFAPPQIGAWGDSQPYSTWGPGTSNWDMSAQKYFRIPIRGLETPRLQFRADFFDAFNHFNLNNPSATIADTRDGGAAVATAGKIYSGTGNRTIQLGLMFEF